VSLSLCVLGSVWFNRLTHPSAFFVVIIGVTVVVAVVLSASLLFFVHALACLREVRCCCFCLFVLCFLAGEAGSGSSTHIYIVCIESEREKKRKRLVFERALWTLATQSSPSLFSFLLISLLPPQPSYILCFFLFVLSLFFFFLWLALGRCHIVVLSPYPSPSLSVSFRRLISLVVT
jgi:hypothetical protein